MRHGISVSQWLEFIDETLDAEQRGRIHAHVSSCPECARLCSELRTWHEAITTEASRLREAVELQAPDAERLLERATEHLRELEPAEFRGSGGWTVAEALMLLRSLVAPYCGWGTACVAVDLAAGRLADGGAAEVAEQRNWPAFVAHLSEALSSICGLTAGRMVDQAGRCCAISGR